MIKIYIHVLYLIIFINTTAFTDAFLGSFNNTAQVTLNGVTYILLNYSFKNSVPNPQFRSEGEYTSEVIDSGENDNTWIMSDYNTTIPNVSTVIGIGLDNGADNASVFFRNGTHENANAVTSLASALSFDRGNYSYTLAGASTSDIIAFASDDDSSDIFQLFLRNGSIITTTTVGTRGYSQALTYNSYGTWDYNVTHGVKCNQSDIIGGFVDTTSTDAVLLCKNGSTMVDPDSEAGITYMFSNSSTFTLPTGLNNTDEVIAVLFDDGADDVAIVFRNGSYVVDSSQTAYGELQPIVFVAGAGKYSFPSNQNVTDFTNLTIFVRASNNTTTWTPWGVVTNRSNIKQIGRYAQFKVWFFSPDKYYTPIINNIELYSDSVIDFNITTEKVNVESYVNWSGSPKYKLPSKVTHSIKGFGFVYNQSQINSSYYVPISNWNKTIYMYLNLSGYRQNGSSCMIERGLGYTINLTNQMGQKEEKQVKRFLDFCSIFTKEINLYNGSYINSTNIIMCLNANMTCSNNYTYIQNKTIKTLRASSYIITNMSNGWLFKFYDMLDFDPLFVDDTDTNWAAGTKVNMNIEGTGGAANLTCQNSSGSFGSQVFDAANTNANWTNISILTEFPYGTEVGRDTNYSSETDTKNRGPFAIYHFNNETKRGDNESVITDWSGNNNNLSVVNAMTYSTTRVLGRYAMSWPGEVGSYLVTKNNFMQGADNLTVSVWAYNSADWSAGGGVNSMFLNKDPTNTDWNFFLESGQLKLRGAANAFTVAYANTWEVNRWYHLVGVIADTDLIASEGTGYIYVDGVLATSGTITDIANTADKLYFGMYNAFGPGYPYSGQMDEIAIWNRSLSADEVKELYLRGAYRENLSVRSCDDAVCAGESWRGPFTNATNGSKLTNINLSSNRYFQYNITCGNFSGYGTAKAVNNNVTIQFDNVSAVGAVSINITCIDDFDRADNPTIGTSKNQNCEANYTTPWSKTEVGLSSFAISSNQLALTMGATGIGTKLERKFNETIITTNLNKTKISIQYINGIAIGAIVGAGKFNDSLGTVLYNLTCTGDVVTGIDCSDARGLVLDNQPLPTNITYNFTSNDTSGKFQYVDICAPGKCVGRPIDNPTSNISGMQIGNIYALATGVVTIESINYTNGTYPLPTTATNSCTYVSGDWNINCADNCVITSNVNLNGNNLHSYGVGTLEIKALIDNVGGVFNRCSPLICRNAGGCFG